MHGVITGFAVMVSSAEIGFCDFALALKQILDPKP